MPTHVDREALARPLVATVFSNPDFASEELLAYELGYRLQPHPQLSLDIAAFYNVYDNLLSLEGPGPPRLSPPVVVIPFTQANKLQGETYGVEVLANYHLADWWRWQGFSRMRMDWDCWWMG